MNIGDKVYAYENGNVYLSSKGDEVIGEIVEITKSGFVIIHSIIDDNMHMVKAENVFGVGTGPIVSKNQIVYEDYYV